MSIQSETINAFEKTIFERAIIKAPARFQSRMLPDDRACFFYLRRGEYHVASQSNRLSLHPGEGVLKKCGSYIAQFLAADKAAECEAITAYLYPEILKEIYRDSVPRFLKAPREAKGLRPLVGNELIEAYIDSLQIYFENPGLVDEELVIIKLKELVLLLLKTDHASSVVELMSDLFHPRAYALKDVVESHLYSDVNVEELAFLCDLSLSSFKREFARLYGESPGHYIRNRKLARAADLLKATVMRVTEVCYECGFNDLANFSTAFHKLYGKSPRRYRMDFLQKSSD